MTPTGGSWITKPGWQIFAGVLVIVFILLGHLSSLSEVQAERDQRQKDFETEAVKRDFNIESAQVKIACAFIRGLEKAFKPGSLDGVTDENTRQRIIQNNFQRTQAILTVRSQMPPEITQKINKKCPPESG